MKILTNTRLTPWDFDENIKQILTNENINKGLPLEILMKILTNTRLTLVDFDENINKYKAYLCLEILMKILTNHKAYPLRFWWKY